MVLLTRFQYSNETCYRDKIPCLTAPCPSYKKFNVKLFANADADADANADADAVGSTIALTRHETTINFTI